jgi:hypothetical protein
MSTTIGRLRSLTWTLVLAAGLVLRPLLIMPMAESGPMRGTMMVPIGLGLLFLSSCLLAVAVFVWGRPLIALAAITAALGIVLAVVAMYAGLPMPWPLLLAALNASLAVLGIPAWREADRPAVG